MYNSDHGDSDNFGAESETSYLVTDMICHSCRDIVSQIVCTKNIVNKLPCPKCQGEFLKGHVANVAHMFNTSLYRLIRPTAVHNTLMIEPPPIFA